MSVDVRVLDVRPTALGVAVRIEIEQHDHEPMRFTEVWEAFEAHYPGQWAVQCFPPRAHFLDQANKYHLFVLDTPPAGLDLCEDPPPGTRPA